MRYDYVTLSNSEWYQLDLLQWSNLPLYINPHTPEVEFSSYITNNYLFYPYIMTEQTFTVYVTQVKEITVERQ